MNDQTKMNELTYHNPEDYVESGNAKRDLSDYKGAIQEYDKAIEIDPNRNSAYYNRGIAKRNAGFAEEAIADYDIAIQLNTDDYFS